MKTNYVIGETYYYVGTPVKLSRIEQDEDEYPLVCLIENECGYFTFTLDGRRWSYGDKCLSTSPTEFIAPKSKEEYGSDMVEQAITLLKSEGYTITKEY